MVWWAWKWWRFAWSLNGPQRIDDGSGSWRSIVGSLLYRVATSAEGEKRSRIYYQDIVYHVCNALDRVEGNHVRLGRGIVCGTADEPSREVQELVDRIVTQRRLVEDALMDAARERDELKLVVEPLNRLRASEGATVVFSCPNPDFNGQPNEVVTVNDDWTGWNDKRFGGDTLAAALAAAEQAQDPA